MNVVSILKAALDRNGVKPAAASRNAGLGDSYIKNIFNGSSPSIDKLALLADELGLELYLGPPRRIHDPLWSGRFSERSLPVIGFASCSMRGWGMVSRAPAPGPAPDGPGEEDAFWVVARGTSMQPEGIRTGDYCLVAATAIPAPGVRVWLQETGGDCTIKRLIAQDDKTVTLRGWLPDKSGKGQHDFTDQRPRSAIADIRPIIAVHDGRPDPSKPPRLIPDPRAIDGPGLALSLARALRAPDDTPPARLIEMVQDLAGGDQPPKEIRAAVDQINRWIRGGMK